MAAYWVRREKEYRLSVVQDVYSDERLKSRSPGALGIRVLRCSHIVLLFTGSPCQPPSGIPARSRVCDYMQYKRWIIERLLWLVICTMKEDHWFCTSHLRLPIRKHLAWTLPTPPFDPRNPASLSNVGLRQNTLTCLVAASQVAALQNGSSSQRG